MPLNLCFDTRNQNKNTRSEFLNHPLETDSERIYANKSSEVGKLKVSAKKKAKVKINSTLFWFSTAIAFVASYANSAKQCLFCSTKAKLGLRGRLSLCDK